MVPVFLPSRVYADDIVSEQLIAGVKIIDAETSAVIPVYDSVPKSRNALPEVYAIADIKELSNEFSDNNGVATYSVAVEMRSGYSQSGSKTTPDIAAKVTVHYNRQGGNICITRVSGGWTIYTSGILLSQREVYAGQGAIGMQTAIWHPSANSFSYCTGWTNYVPEGSGLGVGIYNQGICKAHYTIPGMGSGYEIEAMIRI